MADDASYDGVLRELKSEHGVLMNKYLQKLHNAFHEDNGISISPKDFVKRIKRDCISIFSDNLETIAFDERSEEDVIKEILEYNYNMADIKYMKEAEGVDLFSHLGSLNENCIKRTDPEWFQFGIHELLQEGKVYLGPKGSGRTQFCKCCGEQVYISNKPGR